MDYQRDLGDSEAWRLAAFRPDAFGEPFTRHARAVHVICCWRTGDSALAEDLTSAVFLEAWGLRRSVAISGPPFSHGCPVSPTTPREMPFDRCCRHRGALSRLPRHHDKASLEDEAVDRLDAELSILSAKHMLDGLSEYDREIVLLVFWSGLTYEETARALKIPVGTVCSRVGARSKISGAVHGFRP
jgi:RNA polymerase sigma factor (sigma-70 family)